MKMNFLKYTLITALSLGVFSSCVSEDDYAIPEIKSPIIQEDFQSVVNNGVLDIENWTNFAEAGTVKWIGKIFSGNGYAEFTTFGSGQSSNIGWLVSPKINLMDEESGLYFPEGNVGRKLVFEVSQHHFDNTANTFQVFISTDYDGENVTAATWTEITSNFRMPKTDDSWYDFISSGTYDLSGVEGSFYVAFKAVGNGTNLDGAFMLDNFTIY
jgi:hypothetical protein